MRHHETRRRSRDRPPAPRRGDEKPTPTETIVLATVAAAVGLHLLANPTVGLVVAAAVVLLASLVLLPLLVVRCAIRIVGEGPVVLRRRTGRLESSEPRPAGPLGDE